MTVEEKQEKFNALMESEETYTMIMQAFTVLGAVCQQIESDSFTIGLEQDGVKWNAEFKILSSEKMEETCNTVN